MPQLHLIAAKRGLREGRSVAKPCEAELERARLDEQAKELESSAWDLDGFESQALSKKNADLEHEKLRLAKKCDEFQTKAEVGLEPTSHCVRCERCRMRAGVRRRQRFKGLKMA